MAQSIRHTERLYLPWYHWILPLLAAVLLAAESDVGFPGLIRWLPYVIVIPLTLLFLIRLSSTRIAVRDDTLTVAERSIPLSGIGAVEIVPPKDKRRALGPELDPAAYVRQRGWVPTVLRVEITAAHESAPYWVFSTRHPERLAALLRGQAD